MSGNMGIVREIASYLLTMGVYMLAALPVYLILRLVWLSFSKRSQTIRIGHEIGHLLFVLYCVGLASLTVLPEPGHGPLAFSTEKLTLNPIRVIWITIHSFRQGNPWMFVINFLGNIAIFLPIGFAVAMLWHGKWWAAFVTGCLSSLLIEFIQLFIGRTSDVADVILNTVGALLGWALGSLLLRCPGFSHNRNRNKKKRKPHKGHRILR